MLFNLVCKTLYDLTPFCATLPEICTLCKIGSFSFSNVLRYFTSEILHLLESSLFLKNFLSFSSLSGSYCKGVLADIMPLDIWLLNS